MVTYEIPELYGVTMLSEYGASHLADNVVLLQHAGLDTASVSRTLTVLKTRAGSHDQQTREYDITSEGITLKRG
jgi:circadian clock protein KaiC